MKIELRVERLYNNFESMLTAEFPPENTRHFDRRNDSGAGAEFPPENPRQRASNIGVAFGNGGLHPLRLCDSQH